MTDTLMIESGTLLQRRYLIEEPIARGGMGAVYVGTDRKFGSRVAVKERIYEAEELAAAFEREARLLNSLHHPILPHVSDYFTERGRHFLVMEYIEGEDLSETLKREGAFPATEAAHWALELLDGLDYLHSQQPPVIHRDIKPGNLKLTSRGNIVLLDFGLAKESSANTLAGKSIFGYSRRYSPLEQIEGTGTDARSDIFSLGATVFHLITGEPPVDVLARASAIVAGRPDPLRRANEVNGRVPAPLAAIIHSALALNAVDRFVSANAMRSALEHAIGVKAEASAAVPSAAEGLNEAAGDELYPTVDVLPDPERAASAETTAVFEADLEADGASTGETVSRPAARIPERRVQVRVLQPFWNRSSVWAAVLLGALILLTFAIYRSGVPDQNGAGSLSEPSAGAEIDQAVRNAGNPGLGESQVESTESASGVTVKAADEPETTTAPGGSDSARRGIAGDVVEVTSESAEDEPESPEPRTRPRQLPSRSRVTRDRPARVYRPDFEEDPPVMIIESIFSGIDPERERRREVRRRQRLMSDWELEDRRERRIRDILRHSRRPFPY